ncbi:MAG TPA: hypothetical protein VLL51_04910 [Gemmatimonadales bacterium]|nr:hypothetical protein [Gemmatimonadales bacterium]
MIVLQFLFVVFCSLLLSAHFLRDGALVMMLLSFGILALLFVRERWAGRILQGWLVFGALVWLATGVSLALDRMAQDRPALRLVVIMGSVAGVTLLGARTIQRGRMGRHFRLLDSDARPPESD